MVGWSFAFDALHIHSIIIPSISQQSYHSFLSYFPTRSFTFLITHNLPRQVIRNQWSNFFRTIEISSSLCYIQNGSMWTLAQDKLFFRNKQWSEEREEGREASFQREGLWNGIIAIGHWREEGNSDELKWDILGYEKRREGKRDRRVNKEITPDLLPSPLSPSPSLWTVPFVVLLQITHSHLKNKQIWVKERKGEWVISTMPIEEKSRKERMKNGGRKEKKSPKH